MGILYRFADTKGVLRGRVIVKVILYRFADTKGVLRGRVIVKGILYYARIPRVVEGEGLMLRVHCIVSGLPVMVYGRRVFC